MHVLVTCKYKKDRLKSNREKVETPFPHELSDPARKQSCFTHYKSTGNVLDAQGQLTP